MGAPYYFLLAGIVGVVAGVYLPLNARFGDQVDSPLLATAVFFTIGAVCAISAFILFGRGDSVARLALADKRLMLLGVVSFAIILSATALIPKVGPGAYFVCLVAGQVLAGLSLTHFGWIVGEQLEMTPVKAVGAFLIIGGVLLVFRVESDQRAAQAPLEASDQTLEHSRERS
ncbi:MAG: DMT family transporter [Pseudomonadota bacterium]